jgi:hypothetical protein
MLKTKESTKKCFPSQSPCSGAIYGLGFIGTLVYFVPQASTFQQGLLGFLKAIVWPAILTHQAFTLLGI